ncbi:recombinase family protein [Metabacillus litoralis]|uniref:recombinase family protein n=1 Tax=Metabacillus litoralis TaxID=152268 RepID=UPI000EF5695A|nr:recombinase family protein [Metabacillus litoralis]
MDSLRIGISYCRKSIKPKGTLDDRESILYQEERCLDFCKRNDIYLKYRFSDIGYSGTNTNRPELQKMLNLIKTGDEDITDLIFYTVDRLGRDFRNNIDLVLEISKLVKNITFVVEGITNDHEYFKLILMMKSVFAEEERLLLLDRVNSGRKAVVLFNKLFRGQHKPLGYIQKNKKDLVLADFNETNDLREMQSLEAVQYIFLAYLANVSMTNIKNHLNQYYGLTKRGKTWSTKAVSYILRNDIYAGILTGEFKGERYRVKSEKVEPLLNKDVYQYVQVKLSTERTGRKPKKHLLPQLSLCIHCLKPLVTIPNHVSCNSCKGSMDEAIFIKSVEGSLLDFLFNNPSQNEISQNWKRKLINHFLKLKSLQEEIMQLDGRRVLMESMFYDEPSFLKNLLMHNKIQQDEWIFFTKNRTD